MKNIFFYFSLILFASKNGIAQESGDNIVLFVNGYTDCCLFVPGSNGKVKIGKMVEYFLDRGDFRVFYSPWNGEPKENSSDSQGNFWSGFWDGQGTNNFVNKTTNFINGLSDEDDIYLIGHSFGADSIYDLLSSINSGSKRKIKFVGIFDAVDSGGTRSIKPVFNNVFYFFNRWQVNMDQNPFEPPFDRLTGPEKSGHVPFPPTFHRDQKLVTFYRHEDGSYQHDSCRFFEFCSKKRKRISHSEIVDDPYTINHLKNVIDALVNDSDSYTIAKLDGVVSNLPPWSETRAIEEAEDNFQEVVDSIDSAVKDKLYSGAPKVLNVLYEKVKGCGGLCLDNGGDVRFSEVAYSNAISNIYQDILRRPATVDEKNLHMNNIKNNNWTIQQIRVYTSETDEALGNIYESFSKIVERLPNPQEKDSIISAILSETALDDLALDWANQNEVRNKLSQIFKEKFGHDPDPNKLNQMIYRKSEGISYSELEKEMVKTKTKIAILSIIVN